MSQSSLRAPSLSQSRQRPRKACVTCRSIKIKCVPTSGDATATDDCERCRRLGVACTYKRAVRQYPGSKAAPSLVHETRRSADPTVYSSGNSDDGSRHPGSSQSIFNIPQEPRSLPMIGLDIYNINTPHVQPHAGPSSFTQNPQIPQRLSAGEQLALIGPNMPVGSIPMHGMQTDLASESPRCQAPVSYSIINHLDPASAEAASAEAESITDRRPTADRPDPPSKLIVDGVTMSMMTELESRDLVDRFFTHLQPLIALLDPMFHTFDHLKHNMPILFLAILTSSAKFFRPDLSFMLTEHLRIVINRAIVSEVCTIDMVQAICVCNFWKAPTDSIWLKIGIAIRLAYQLRLHEAKDAPLESSELERRKTADAQRTWYCLACFEFLYSTLFDLPCAMRFGTFRDPLEWQRVVADLGVNDDTQLAFSFASQGSFSMVMRSSPDGHAPTRLMELENVEDRFDSLIRSFNLGGDSTKANVTSRTLNRLRNFINLTKLLFGAQRYESLASEYHSDQVLERAETWLSSLRALAVDGQVMYFQDAFYVFFTRAGHYLCQMMPQVRPRSRQRILEILLQVHTLCSDCVRQVGNDSGCYYVARYYARLLRQAKAQTITGYDPTTDDQEVGNRRDMSFDTAEFLQQLDTFLDTADLEQGNYPVPSYWDDLLQHAPW